MTMIAVHRGEPEEAPLELAERILEAALVLAEEHGWQAVRLTEVAARLGLPAGRVLDHYRDLDAVADAWFRRGLAAMLADPPEGFGERPARERLEHCLLAWFDALADHRRVTGQMLHTKAHPPHPHTWVPMPFELSRVIQWLRQAARLEAPYGSRRASLEELGLTALFLATLRVWLRDASPGQQETRHYLAKRLSRGERLMRWDGAESRR